MTLGPRVYDTRYFWAVYVKRDPESISKLRMLLVPPRERYASAVTLYEVYRLSISREGRETAELRCSMIKRDMRIVEVSAEIAEEAAKVSHRAKKPMADALIIATAKVLQAECVTDDPHFTEVKTRWI